MLEKTKKKVSRQMFINRGTEMAKFKVNNEWGFIFNTRKGVNL